MRLQSPDLFLSLLLTGVVIGAATWPAAAAEGQRPTGRVQRAASSAAPLTFVTYTYVDPAVGIEAFRLLIPKGWQVQGGIDWSTNPALPAASRFRFFNPPGAEQFEILPTQSFFWTDNRLFLTTNPPGTLRFGTRVAPPVDLDAAFSRLLLPQFRSGIEGFEVLKRQAAPDLAKLAVGPPRPGSRPRAMRASSVSHIA